MVRSSEERQRNRNLTEEITDQVRFMEWDYHDRIVLLNVATGILGCSSDLPNREREPCPEINPLILFPLPNADRKTLSIHCLIGLNHLPLSPIQYPIEKVL
jgi:hypothetical protein